MMTISKRHTVGAVVVAGLALSGCAATAPDSGDDARYADDGVFAMAVNFELADFDIYSERRLLGLGYLAYDPLVHQVGEHEFVSGLAESWDVTAESAEFTLREGVTCSDGTDLTAAQVAASLEFAADPANQSAHYAVNTPNVPIEVLFDDAARTVTVVPEQPFGFLLNTIGQLPIACATAFSDPEVFRGSSSGTGPFVVVSVEPGQTVTLERRDDYAWGPDGLTNESAGVPKTIELRHVANETTAANLVLSGELNFANVSGSDRQRLDGAGLASEPFANSGAWLSFNQQPGKPTAERDVRTALVASLDMNEVLQISTDGEGSMASGLTVLQPVACEGTPVSEFLPAFDPEAAASALDDAGWLLDDNGRRAKDGTPLSIGLHYQAQLAAYDKPTAELLADRWEALGIDVTIQADSSTQVVEVLYQTSNWDVYLTGYEFQVPSQLVPYLSGPTPPDGVNLGFVSNAEYERLTSEAIELVAEEGCPLWMDAEVAILTDLNLAPLTSRDETWFLNAAEAKPARYDAPIPTSIRVLE